VPKELGQLANLTALYLHDNDQLGLSNEILGPTWKQVNRGATAANPQDILNYYFQASSRSHPSQRSQADFGGFGAVGKTSLVNRLIHDKFDRDSPKLTAFRSPNGPSPSTMTEDITLHVWDFGGQEIMHSTHQFFLTERSLYLLVLNGRQGHEDEDADYWLELIQSFGGSSPVIVALNKISEQPFDVNRACPSAKISPTFAPSSPPIARRKQGWRSCGRPLSKKPIALEHLRAPFPPVGSAIKNAWPRWRTTTFPLSNTAQFCQHDGEADLGQQDSLAVHLHSLGIALNYKDDPRLRDTHVLNPRWVTNGIYTLLNAQELSRHAKGNSKPPAWVAPSIAAAYPPERHGFCSISCVSSSCASASKKTMAAS
jgi:internalin A